MLKSILNNIKVNTNIIIITLIIIMSIIVNIIQFNVANQYQNQITKTNIQLSVLQQQMLQLQVPLRDNILNVCRIENRMAHYEQVSATFSLVIDEVIDKVERID